MAVTDDKLAPGGGRPDLGLAGRANPEARMPLIEHLRELRKRVVRIVLAIVAGSVIGWLLYAHVWHFLETPYCRIPSVARQAPGVAEGGCRLYVTGIFDALVLRLQISIATGVVLSSPVWLYQFWAFIAPGLYRRERRWAYWFVGIALPLFAIGATIAYFAMTRGLRFLLSLVPAQVTPLITINTYLSYAGAMLLIFGIAFEMPLVVVLLNLAGMLTHKRFAQSRRTIIFLVFAFAAVFTPSPDPLSMLLLAVPCLVLVECAEVFAWAHDRRLARHESLAFPGLTEEEVQRYGLDSADGED
jgi:sec-independent protein translocase protein TatC